VTGIYATVYAIFAKGNGLLSVYARGQDPLTSIAVAYQKRSSANSNLVFSRVGQDGRVASL
jgi:hypothetical protein